MQDEIFDKDIYNALEWCIYKKIPFAMYALPGKSKIEFWAAPSLIGSSPEEWKIRPQEGGFIISPFLHRFADSYWIPLELSASELLARRYSIPEASCDLPPLAIESTSRQAHIEAVSKTIEKVKAREHGKTVLSIIRTNFMPDWDAADFASEMFYAHTSTFRHCYFHPATGFWMGASPELLLECDKAKGSMRTMALAGTTHCDSDVWDVKNQKEHRIVSAFIAGTLDYIGVKDLKIKETERAFGDLAHLCTEFRGSIKSAGLEPNEIINNLNPTPALLGWPQEEAIKDILDAEEHQRECYGGFIGIDTPAKLLAYVNIRCIQFSGSTFRFYGGGGIMPDSDPEEEWREANNKIDNLF